MMGSRGRQSDRFPPTAAQKNVFARNGRADTLAGELIVHKRAMSSGLALECGPGGERIRSPGPARIGWRPWRSNAPPLCQPHVRHLPVRDRLVVMVLGRGLAAACLAAVLAATVDAARTQPVVFRLGYGGAAEEPVWLLVAKPDLARNYGKAYTLDATKFTSSDKRAQAFEAGAIDLSAGSANGVIFAAAEGVKATFIASISRESSRGFSTAFYVRPSLAEGRARQAWAGRDRCEDHAGAVFRDAGIARRREDRHRTVSAALRRPGGEADEGAQDLRRQIWDTVRGGAHGSGRKGSLPQEQCGCHPRDAAGPDRVDAVLSRAPARSPAASDRCQDGSRASRRLHEHAGLLSRPHAAGRRRGARADAGIPDQGRIPA